MIQKTLLAFALIISASVLNAANNSDQNKILENVKKLSEEDMRSVKGEDIMVTVVYPSTGETEHYVIVSDDYIGLRKINGETGEIISEKIKYIGNL